MTDLTCAVITLFSAGRIEHVQRQIETVRHTFAPGIRLRHIAVCLDSHAAGASCISAIDAGFAGTSVLHVAPGPAGMRLARARNEGAAAALQAGARLFVFLDADCLPGPTLLPRYADAARIHPAAILCGPVTYLPETQQTFDADVLQAATDPHPARAFPTDGQLKIATAAEYPLFWSLSFALTAQTWAATGGFCEDYEGYGGEDTDFAYAARRDAIALAWVGGAHAYHQHHPTSSPPWQHLDAILRNGKVFADRWGEWPMSGWLDAFADAGAIEYAHGVWMRTASSRNAPAPTGNTLHADPVTA